MNRELNCDRFFLENGFPKDPGLMGCNFVRRKTLGLYWLHDAHCRNAQGLEAFPSVQARPVGRNHDQINVASLAGFAACVRTEQEDSLRVNADAL